MQCWSESPSARPTAEDLLRCPQDTPPTWAPPLQYPIPDDSDGEVGTDFMFRGEWSVVAGALAGSFFTLLVVTLCFFVLSLH